MLIDADNAQPSITEGLLAEVAKYGTAHVKRAYGDWTAPQLKGWKDQLLSQSIQPIQQFAYTRGKNATDAAMVIDAMDLLYSGRFDGFCIVSSDSDFTRLAARLRESALTVYGFGERKTPKPFVAACDKFIYIENLTFDDSDDDEDENGAATRAAGASVRPPRRKPATAAELKNDVSLVTFLRNALEAASDDDGWAPLAGVGNIITNQRPDFDPRSYGYRKLSDLITATTLFETDRRSPGDGKQPIIYARLKRRRSPAKRTTTRTAARTTAAKAVAPLKALRRRLTAERRYTESIHWATRAASRSIRPGSRKVFASSAVPWYRAMSSMARSRPSERPMAWNCRAAQSTGTRISSAVIPGPSARLSSSVHSEPRGHPYRPIRSLCCDRAPITAFSRSRGVAYAPSIAASIAFASSRCVSITARTMSFLVLK